MRKILATVCSLAACAASAQTVSVSGVVDAYIGRLQNAGDTGSTNVVNGGGLSTYQSKLRSQE